MFINSDFVLCTCECKYGPERMWASEELLYAEPHAHKHTHAHNVLTSIVLPSYDEGESESPQS